VGKNMATNETYAQVVKSLYANWVPTDEKSRLGMLQEILHWIGDPDRKLKIIHVSGTNGKGSTGAMLASILMAAGYKVGHFSTPAIINEREVIRINDEMISENEFMDNYSEILADLTAHGGHRETLAGFEWWTLVALRYFASQEVDFVILEAGLGGLNDATNMVETPMVVAFTKINVDDSEEKLSNLHEIAAEKAAIMKPGAMVVNYPGQDIAVYKLLKAKAEEVGATWSPFERPKITIISGSPRGLVLNADQLENLHLSLTGAFQANNLSTVLQIVTVLRSKGFEIKDQEVATALAHVKIPGRMEYDAERNLLLDGAHNPEGIRALVASLRAWHLPFKPTVVLGLMKDKNSNEMLEELLPHVGTVIAVTPEAAPEKVMTADALAAEIVMMSNVDVEIADDPSAAVQLARRVRESSQALIIVTGSFFTLRAVQSEGF
jgi:dihydrofolate synthase/folylpolyglutamate synthase